MIIRMVSISYSLTSVINLLQQSFFYITAFIDAFQTRLHLEQDVSFYSKSEF